MRGPGIPNPNPNPNPNPSPIPNPNPNPNPNPHQDGLLSSVMRDLANAPDTNPKWIILDGDLDANWIENMNSVMDDNRLLTLASNERIRLLGNMKLLFEIRDLLYASPATVTRAG